LEPQNAGNWRPFEALSALEQSRYLERKNHNQLFSLADTNCVISLRANRSRKQGKNRSQITLKIGFKNHHHGGFGYLLIFPIERWAFSDADLDACPDPKSAQQSVLNLVLEIRANGQRTNASDFRVLRLPQRNEFCAAEFDLIDLPIRVLQESVNRAKSERKIGRICVLSKFRQCQCVSCHN